MGILKEKGCVKTDKTLKAFFCLTFFFSKINTFSPEANYTAVTTQTTPLCILLIAKRRLIFIDWQTSLTGCRLTSLRVSPQPIRVTAGG